MTIGIWMLGDQLWLEPAAKKSCSQNPKITPVILIESCNHIKERWYHRQKVVLVWSAMRHFAEELKQSGYRVSYEKADDFLTPLQNWIKREKITELRVMTPNDRPFLKLIQELKLNCKITLIPNNHFLWSTDEFKTWAKTRKRLLLEDFYREGRKRFKVLMNGKDPIGGKWNFDKENRKPPKGELKTPKPIWFEPDEITLEVIETVNKFDFPLYGNIQPFRWGVTRQQALIILEHFIQHNLATFGPYQDAMITGEETMWHSLISPYLNLGLLTPFEVIQAVENAFYEQKLEINSIEGYIRQVLGWREYLHGFYHYSDENYAQNNWFNHTEPLPAFYWDSSLTDMNCLHQTLSQVEKMGYAHHIQRLMVLNNFALIIGVSPQEIENWFHAVFIDAYDWVMQTNVIGMGQFADGGLLASKPYAASANYIDKMSDYCGKCVYQKNTRIGEKACPFNYFYWDFLLRHQDQLRDQGRMSLILGHLDRLTTDEINMIQFQAHQWRQQQKSHKT